MYIRKEYPLDIHDNISIRICTHKHALSMVLHEQPWQFYSSRTPLENSQTGKFEKYSRQINPVKGVPAARYNSSTWETDETVI